MVSGSIENSEEKLNFTHKFFFVILILVSFDGLIRLISYWIGISLLNFYKEILFALWFLLVLLNLYLTKGFISIPTKSRYFIFFGFILLISIVIGITSNYYESLFIPLWGIKTSFFYFPILFFLSCSIKQTTTFFNKLINVYALLIIPIVVFGIIQFFGGANLYNFLGYPNNYEIISLQYEDYWGDIRPVGTFRSANDYGMFCLFLVVFFFFKFEKYRTTQVKFALLFSLLGLLTSSSKNSIVGLFIFIIYAILIKKKKYNLILQIKFLLPILVFFVITLTNLRFVGLNFIDMDYNSLASGDINFDDVYALPTGSSAVRLVRWASNITDFLHYNLIEVLFGKGYGNYGIGRYIGSLLNIESIKTDYHIIVDNNYIMFLLNIGIIGLFVSYLLVKQIVSLYLRIISACSIWYVNAGLVFFLIMLTNAFFINVLESFPGQIFIFLVIAIPFVYRRKKIFIKFT